MRSLRALTAIALLLFAAGTPVAADQVAGQDRPAETPAEPSLSAVHETTPHYAFRSHPWLTLHHFLYQWACTEDASRRCASRITMSEKEELDTLTDEEQADWDDALSVYRELQDRNLLFDDALIDAKEHLRRHPDTVATDLDTLPLDLDRALRAAMPVYRAHWWSQHRGHARTWMAETAAALRPVEAEAIAMMEHVYDGTWPTEPVRIDVMPYTRWSGAYTTVRPVHVVMTADATGGDLRDLETLFHEPAHGNFFFQPLKRTLRDTFAAYDRTPPDRLWHAVIFYVAGEVTRRTAARTPAARPPTAGTTTDFNPYWTRIRAFTDGPRKAHFDAMKHTLGALFNGMIERDAAFDALASRIGR